MMRTRLLAASAVLTAGFISTPASALIQGEIVAFDPLADPVNANLIVDLNNTQTWSGAHQRNGGGSPEPYVHWFKYTSDGNSAVTFDTYGTNISSEGPDPDRSQGSFVNSVNQTQLALFDASGNLVAQSGAVKDIDGEIVPEFPGAGWDPQDPDHYRANTGLGLSEMIFMQNAPDNPHWDTSPGGISDPLSTTPYEGLHVNDCPDTVCSGQKYAADENGIWNEYRVWNETLQGVIDDELQGWRASDHYNVGPNADWNRFEALPAGEYYLAVAGAGPVFSGDTAKEEYLMAPIHFLVDNSDPFNPVNHPDTPRINAPMGAFEHYKAEENALFPSAWGTIQLNVTHFSLALEGDLDGDGFVGINDLNIVLANWNQNVPPANPLADPSGDGFVGIDDLNAVLGNWNAGTPPTANTAIPEPASLALLGLGGLAAIRRRC